VKRYALMGTVAKIARGAPKTAGRGAARIAGGAALTAACARVSFDLPGEVPITGQTFGVLVCGGVLGPRDGALGQVVYVALDGRERLAGPTGGFLLSFPLAAWVTGYLAARPAVAVTAGTVVPFALGVPWLARKVGARAAVEQGLLPFLPGAVLKGAAAVAVIRRLRP
jgi:biotin transport system substrate-specific component